MPYADLERKRATDRARYHASKRDPEKLEKMRVASRERMARRHASHSDEINARRRAAYLDYQKGHWLKKKYRLSVAGYEALMEAQGSVCAICGEPERMLRGGALQRLSVDHCHTSMAVRGLLCQLCNSGLGAFRDRPELMARAIAYLARPKREAGAP